MLAVYCICSLFLKQRLQPVVLADLLLLTSLLLLLSRVRLKGKLVLALLTAAATVPWLYYHYIGALFFSTLSAVPIAAVEPIDGQVSLGGGHIVLLKPARQLNAPPPTAVFTTNYYLGPELVVGAAHKMDLDLDMYQASLTVQGEIQTGSIQVLVNSDYGALVRLIGMSSPETALTPIGGTESIAVGETAEVLSTYGWSGSVTVAGYHSQNGQQYLLLTTPAGTRDAQPGMSGSPVLQNGKVIGFLDAVIPGEYKGARLCRARLAAVVYRQIQAEITRLVAETQGVDGGLRDVLLPFGDQIERGPDPEMVKVMTEATDSILTVSGIEVDKYYRVGIWDLPNLSDGKLTLPGVENVTEILRVIGKAEQDHHRVGDFAPLILVKKDGSQVILGLNRGDRLASFYRYTATQTGAWRYTEWDVALR